MRQNLKGLTAREQNMFEWRQEPCQFHDITHKVSLPKAVFTLGCPSMVPEYDSCWALINVNTPFFQGPTPEFWHGARPRVQGLDLVLGHCSGH